MRFDFTGDFPSENLKRIGDELIDLLRRYEIHEVGNVSIRFDAVRKGQVYEFKNQDLDTTNFGIDWEEHIKRPEGQQIPLSIPIGEGVELRPTFPPLNPIDLLWFRE